MLDGHMRQRWHGWRRARGHDGLGRPRQVTRRQRPRGEASAPRDVATFDGVGARPHEPDRRAARTRARGARLALSPATRRRLAGGARLRLVVLRRAVIAVVVVVALTRARVGSVKLVVLVVLSRLARFAAARRPALGGCTVVGVGVRIRFRFQLGVAAALLPPPQPATAGGHVAV